MAARRSIHIRHSDRVGERAERGRERRLVARLDRQQGGDAAEQSGHLLGAGEQRPGTVLAAQPEPERLLAGLPLGRFLLGGALEVAELLELRADRRPRR